MSAVRCGIASRCRAVPHGSTLTAWALIAVAVLIVAAAMVTVILWYCRTPEEAAMASGARQLHRGELDIRVSRHGEIFVTGTRETGKRP